MKVAPTAVAAMLVALIAAIPVALADECNEDFGGVSLTRRLFLDIGAFDIIDSQNRQTSLNRICAWQTRQELRVPPGCNARGVTITGNGTRPPAIDIQRLSDDVTAAQRTPTGSDGNWTLEYNGSMLCTTGDCRASIYRVETCDPALLGVCPQTVQIWLRLY